MCLEILDRVGGGDSFASGLVHGLLDGQPLETAVEYGAAHGALAMTTPGDSSMVAEAEVLELAAGGGARVDRSTRGRRGKRYAGERPLPRTTQQRPVECACPPSRRPPT